jgi:hypothetical protein
MVKWLTAVWDILPGALLREREMQVLYALKHHLTHKVNTPTSVMNSDLVTHQKLLTILDVAVNKQQQ